MAERQRARQVEEEKVEEVVVEEKGVIALYQAMLEKVEEMHGIALKVESGPQIALVLSAVAMVKVQVEGAMEKVREERAMEESARVYEGREEVKDE